MILSAKQNTCILPISGENTITVGNFVNKIQLKKYLTF